MTRIVQIQQESLPDGTQPWPLAFGEDHIVKYYEKAGITDFLVGFTEPNVEGMKVLFADFFEDPELSIGLVPVYSDGRAFFTRNQFPVESARVLGL